MFPCLRRLSRNEMEQVALIHREAFDERFPWLVRLHTPAEDHAFFRDRVFVECEVWGAVDQEVIGFISFREGWIDHLCVLPRWQGQGVGCGLLRVAQATSRSLRLWTFQRNVAARRFYEKQGFIVVRETDGSGNEEREPDILYQWHQVASGLSDAE